MPPPTCRHCGRPMARPPDDGPWWCQPCGAVVVEVGVPFRFPGVGSGRDAEPGEVDWRALMIADEPPLWTADQPAIDPSPGQRRVVVARANGGPAPREVPAGVFVLAVALELTDGQLVELEDDGRWSIRIGGERLTFPATIDEGVIAMARALAREMGPS